jgi:hypothetical protein
VSDEVVGLGAWCDFVPEDVSLASQGSVCFDVHEFAVLADGRRLTLHAGERGFGVSGPRTHSTHPLGTMTAMDIEAGVLTTVLPDDVDTLEEHPYEWLRDLLRAHRVEVSIESLRAVPYTVEFSERLQRLIHDRATAGGT